MTAFVAASATAYQDNAGNTRIPTPVIPAFADAQVGDRIVFLTYNTASPEATGRPDLVPPGLVRFGLDIVQAYYIDITSANRTTSYRFSGVSVAVLEAYASAFLIRGADRSRTPVLDLNGTPPNESGFFSPPVTAHPGLPTRYRNSLVLWQQRARNGVAAPSGQLIPDSPAGWTGFNPDSRVMRSASRPFPAVGPTGPIAVAAVIQQADYIALVEVPSANTAPTAAVRVSPADGQALNKDVVQRLTFQHVDPDGDGQTAFDLRYRVQGAPGWTEVHGDTPNGFVDLPAGSLTVAAYEWQVRTYDLDRVFGAYSSSGFFTADTPPPGPVITAPISGQTIGQAGAALTWTTPSQTAYQVRKLADAAGQPDQASPLYDSGEVTSSTVRSVDLTFDVNSRYEHLQVRVKVAGLWSPWSSLRVLVSYTLPATARLSVAAVASPGLAAAFTDALAVTIVNPPPTNGQPARSYNRVYVVATTDGDYLRPRGVRKLLADLVVGSRVLDHQVVSGVGYAYQAATLGDNGTTSMSELVAETRDLGQPITGGPEGDFADVDFATADFA